MNKLVSIIVPVYNVEKYLERCINSIIQQSYNDLEIILIDDGSTDASGKICDEYKEKDDRIIVIHKENGGLSDARNAGIKIFTGEYVTFIDSDDYVSKNMVSNMLDILEKSSCRIVQVEFIKGYAYDYTFMETGEYRVYSKREAFENRDVHVCVCGKMYESSIARERYFPVGKINEDEYYTYKCVYEAEKIAVMKDKMYYYFQQPNSIMHKKSSYLRLDALEAYDERIEYFHQKKEERLANISIKEKCIRETLLYARAKGCTDEKEKRSYLQSLFKSDYKKIRGQRYSVKEQLFLESYYHIPKVINLILERKVR